MSHPSRVRGLKSYFNRGEKGEQGSHPSRVRGLKSDDPKYTDTVPESHPSRVRGLKFLIFPISYPLTPVAPLAGAWIEISRWRREELYKKVAPLAGAWIEIPTWICILY